MHVLIADGHAVVRRGLREILAEVLPSASFAEAAHGDDVIACLAQRSAQLLLLDVNMPGQSSLDLLREVRSRYPRMPMIAMGAHSDDSYGVRCLKAGAAAYISIEAAPEELAQATRKVLAGGRYVSPELAEKLIATVEHRNSQPPHEQLSDREHEVMRMIAEGMPLTEMASALHVSVKTVSTYRARILAKMEMKSNAELIRYALTHGLVA